MTTISRLFGLARDIVIAYFYAAGSGSDAFFVAFKIPNYLRRLFAEGGFSQAFVPVLTEYKNQRDENAVQDLLNHVSGKLALVLFCVTAVGVIAAPIVIMIFAPGFAGDEDKFGLSVYMLRITFPYILFISLTPGWSFFNRGRGNRFIPIKKGIWKSNCNMPAIKTPHANAVTG